MFRVRRVKLCEKQYHLFAPDLIIAIKNYTRNIFVP